MKSLMVLVLALFTSGSAVAQATFWKIDPVHSSITFAIDYMVLSEVTGNFKEYNSTMTSDGEMPGMSTVNVAIKTASINTDNEKRDGHLRSADFFDAQNHPEISFVSTSLERGEGNSYKVVGDLTMRGVTKPISIDAQYMGEVKDMRGNIRRGFRGTATLKRNDFGVKYNSALEGGGLVLGTDVKVTINAQYLKQQERAEVKQ